MRTRFPLVAWLAALAALAALVAVSPRARAFCGFYVGGADAKLFNNATMVVLMREGTRTVLSMQNNYQGPSEKFAMVVPVPVILAEDNVKTLPREVFDRVDTLAAPRLVEYWEQDPCYKPDPRKYARDEMSGGAPPEPTAPPRGAGDLGVTVEAEFTVGEYNIQILSAKDAGGLDTWLRQEKYNIPEGAEPLFKPYIAEGWKFFVAKVDPEKVTFKDGQAMLSPLRFHYDSPDFKLPVRLGLINSAGTQDLIVHILARGQRYELANYKNAFIPTNLDVAEDVRGPAFGQFYAALFDATLEKNPGAVITEYAWVASSCDPCPGGSAGLSNADLMTLGGDALPATGGDDGGGAALPPSPPPPAPGPGGPGAGAPRGDMARPMPPRPPRPMPNLGGFVLTRLHARYSKDSLGEDLVFQAAPPVGGGREYWTSPDHSTSAGLEHGAVPDGQNNFQGRYIIRHPWEGKIDCKDPKRWVWGGPPGGAPPAPAAAKDTAFAKRGAMALPSVVRQDVPEIALKTSNPFAPAAAAASKDTGKKDRAASGETAKKGCGCGTTGSTPADLAGLLLVVLAILTIRRGRC